MGRRGLIMTGPSEGGKRGERVSERRVGTGLGGLILNGLWVI